MIIFFFPDNIEVKSLYIYLFEVQMVKKGNRLFLLIGWRGRFSSKYTLSLSMETSNPWVPGTVVL